MLSGIIRHFAALVAVLTVLTGTVTLACGTAAGDSQDDKFLELLGQKDVPAVDNADSLFATGHKVCTKLDGGMSVNDLVELIRNNGFNDNPLARFYPQDRITTTIDRFITAAVQAYCPYDAGKIASIAAYVPPARRAGSRVVVLASVVTTLPAGEIPPTKPLPVPAKPPPSPQELAPAPQEPPPPPKRLPQAPRQQQVEPPPQEAPPQEPPPQAEPPQAPAPAAPAPGNDNGGAPPPESPPPAPPGPPGHVRLAP